MSINISYICHTSVTKKVSNNLPNLNLKSIPQAQALMAKIAFERYTVYQNTHPALTSLIIRPNHAMIRVGRKTIIEMEVIVDDTTV